jgi:hypothetical protein
VEAEDVAAEEAAEAGGADFGVRAWPVAAVVVEHH